MKRRWSGSDEVLSAFHQCTAQERQRLLDFFGRLAESPDQFEDYAERGADGRLYSVLHFSPWIMTYWVDPDGCVLRMIDLELVD